MTRTEPELDIPLADWDFRFRSDRLCLDFIATVGDRDHLAFDRWRNEHDFGRWCVEAGLLADAIAVTDNQLNGARLLREALFRLVSGAVMHIEAPLEDLRLINQEARKSPLIPQLNAFGQPCAWVSESPYDAVLATVTRDAVDLLSGTAMRRVRKCADTHCSILFLDMSRPGKRRWCSMNGCGNKVKKAAYRRRQRV